MKIEKKVDIADYLIEIKKKGFRCLRCGNEWEPRKKKHKPQTCPKCRTRYWDKPKKIKQGHKI